MNDSQFDLEHQYQLYLKRMALSEATMHPEQKTQLRQTFYGAIAQMLILQRDEMAQLSDAEMQSVFQNWMDQIDKFWQEDLKRHQGGRRMN